jgi:hypothetical protein
VHDQRHVLCKNALDNDLNKIETCLKTKVKQKLNKAKQKQKLKTKFFMTSGGDGG